MEIQTYLSYEFNFDSLVLQLRPWFSECDVYLQREKQHIGLLPLIKFIITDRQPINFGDASAAK